MKESSDNWSKLQKYKVDNKDNLNRRINQLKKVIQEPDKYNINLTSRDNMLMLSGSVEELNKQVNALNSRIDGLSYLVNQDDVPDGIEDWTSSDAKAVFIE